MEKSSTAPVAGVVYCYQYKEEVESLPHYYKIGHTNDIVRRMREWANNDGMTPLVRFSVATQDKVRLETITHAFFRNQKKIRYILNPKTRE